MEARSSGQQAVFLFVDEEPSTVAIYPDLDWARESLESEDVASFKDQAFTADGQVVEVTESGNLFATLTLTDRFEPDLLRVLLAAVDGPRHLANNPATYAHEWLRLDRIDAERPPFLPPAVWNWLKRRYPGIANGKVWRD